MTRPQQARTKTITWNQAMKSKWFQIGVKDFHAGKWRDLWGDDAQLQWSYERGRLFARCTGIRHVTKTGSRVDVDLQQMFAEQYHNGNII